MGPIIAQWCKHHLSDVWLICDQSLPMIHFFLIISVLLLFYFITDITINKKCIVSLHKKYIFNCKNPKV